MATKKTMIIIQDSLGDKWPHLNHTRQKLKKKLNVLVHIRNFRNGWIQSLMLIEHIFFLSLSYLFFFLLPFLYWFLCFSAVNAFLYVARKSILGSSILYHIQSLLS